MWKDIMICICAGIVYVSLITTIILVIKNVKIGGENSEKEKKETESSG